MIAVLDHYDSFTHNIVDIFRKNSMDVEVFQTHETSKLHAKSKSIDLLILSPGPGHPCQAQEAQNLLQTYKGKKPILGLCLGHQVIGHFFQAPIQKAPKIRHGLRVPIHHTQQGAYKGMNQGFQATCYNSLLVGALPRGFQLTSWTFGKDKGVRDIMGFRHDRWPIEGVQFHPESVGTALGEKWLLNFLKTL